MDTKKPVWLKKKIDLRALTEMQALLRSLSLHTVCEGADCPNRGECFKAGTATFMILGDTCTRGCRFCAVSKGRPAPPDPSEPEHLADAAEKLKLKHVVVTSVTRDDLEDGGASHFAAVIRAVKSRIPATIEVLIPDFKGSEQALYKVIEAKPDIINHNLETVPSLYKAVRPNAVYERSLELLKRVKRSGIISKTGIMVGLGETEREVLSLLEDIAALRCDMLTIGQYLRPSKDHIPVAEYVRPETFEAYKQAALEKGIRYVASAPLVRSSYNAAEGIKAVKAI